MERPLLEIENLHTYFFLEPGVLKAVCGVSLRISRQKIIGVVGESGCGKSTLGFSLIRLLRKPGRIVQGQIRFHGEDLLKKTEKDMEAIRGNKISMIFQDPLTYLNPSSPVGHQIAESILVHRGAKRDEARDKSVEMLRSMGVPSPVERALNYPHQLSGGICQRVMIAMALCCEPDLIIADEPTTALDVTIQAQILELLKRIRAEHGTSIILITHDLGIVARMCEFVAIMYAGQIVEYGDAFTIFDHPRHPYTIGLIHSIPKISFQQKGDRPRRLAAIAGQPPDLSQILANQCSFLPRCTQALPACAAQDPGIKPIDGEHWVRCLRGVE